MVGCGDKKQCWDKDKCWNDKKQCWNAGIKTNAGMIKSRCWNAGIKTNAGMIKNNAGIKIMLECWDKDKCWDAGMLELIILGLGMVGGRDESLRLG